MTRFNTLLGAGCVATAAALLAAPATAQSQRSSGDTQYRSQYRDVDVYTNRSGGADSTRYSVDVDRRYEPARDYDPRTQTFRSSAGDQSVSRTQQWYGDREQPVPMQYRTSDQYPSGEYRDYNAGIYRDADRDDRDSRFRSSAGSQSVSGTQRWYGDTDYDNRYERQRSTRDQQRIQQQRDYRDSGVYATDRDQQWWQRQDQAEYNPQYDRTDERYQYERQQTAGGDADTRVYYRTDRDRYQPSDRSWSQDDRTQTYIIRERDRDADQPVPFNYENQTQLEDRDDRYQPSDRYSGTEFQTETYIERDTQRYPMNRTYRDSYDVRIESDRPVQRAQPRGAEYRSDGGWYYDEDRQVWFRLPDRTQRN